MLYPAHTSPNEFAVAYDALPADERPEYVSGLVITPEGDEIITLNGLAEQAFAWATKIVEAGRAVVLRLHDEPVPYIGDALNKAFIRAEIEPVDLRHMESWQIEKAGTGRAHIFHNGIRIGAVTLRSCERQVRSNGLVGERWNYVAEGVNGPSWADEAAGKPEAFGPQVSMGGTSAALPFEPFPAVRLDDRRANLKIVEGN